jgi:hypothetical protein
MVMYVTNPAKSTAPSTRLTRIPDARQECKTARAANEGFASAHQQQETDGHQHSIQHHRVPRATAWRHATAVVLMAVV